MVLNLIIDKINPKNEIKIKPLILKMKYNKQGILTFFTKKCGKSFKIKIF